MNRNIIVDLHIHSRYSMATSKNLTPEHLQWWANRKGIDVLGTGDATHPGWLSELEEKLLPAEQGLYALNKDFLIPDELSFPGKKMRFILTTEISSIYKHLGKTRKIHNVFVFPDLNSARLYQKNLEARGVNIRSDGRPICGLSAHDLLDLALHTDERIYCIPAHIWTPWFSLFGAKSGYDDINECFADLTPYIKTLETGLSADVPMIRLVSALDKYSLISSSDAHSPGNIGRNATILNADYNYESIIGALKAGDTSTIDMYPQAGKYHYDGHRKCGVCWHPLETARHNGVCSVCGKPVTIGVLNRVYQLADRTELPADWTCNWKYIMTLPQIISRICGKGENTKTVSRKYLQVMGHGLREFEILFGDKELLRSNKVESDVIAFIDSFSTGSLELKPGFDGEYGSVDVKY